MRYSTLFGQSELDLTFLHWYTSPAMNNGDNAAFHEHAPTLALLSHNKTVLELGMRYGMSTLGILTGRPRSLTSVDIQYFETMGDIKRLADSAGIDYNLIIGNDLDHDVIQQTTALTPDVLFIDTLHDYIQLRRELEIYAPHTKEYIVMHDIVSFADRDESSADGNGLLFAIEEFIANNNDWEVASYYFNCNGLMILRRKY